MTPPSARRSKGPAFHRPGVNTSETLLLVRFVFSTTLILLCFGTITILASISKIPVSRLIALCLVAHVPYAYAVISFWRQLPSSIRIGQIILISLLFRGALVAAPPTFSDDIYRYVWDGKVLLSGVNPYKYAPLDEALTPLRDADWSRINHPELRTIYPPASEIIFAAIARISATPYAFKAVSALADTGIVLLIYLLLGGKVGPVKRALSKRAEGQSHRALVCALAYGFHPLPCVETAMSGHLEPIALVLLLAAIHGLKIGRDRLSTFSLSLAVAIKLAPVFLLPSLARKRVGVWLAVLFLVLASYVAFSSTAGTGTIESLDAFARRWEGNGGLFVAVKSISRLVLTSVTGVNQDGDIVHIPALDPLARSLHTTFFSLHKEATFRPEAPASFPLQDLVLAVSKIVMAFALLAVFSATILRKMKPIRAATWIFGTLVLVTPVLHPWYILWILPFGIMRGHLAWTVLAGLSFLSYIPLDDWWQQGVWRTPYYVPVVEYGGFLVSVILLRLLDQTPKST